MPSDLCVLTLLPVETPGKKPWYTPVHNLLILLSVYARQACAVPYTNTNYNDHSIVTTYVIQK